MTSPEIGEERMEALLAGAAPATPAEEELVAVMAELRGEPVEAPASLRARVRALEAAPTRLGRLRAALAGPGLRRAMLVAAPACSLALAAGVVIGIGQRPSHAPPSTEMTQSTGSQRTAEPPAGAARGAGPREDQPRAAAPDASPSNGPAPTSAPVPAPSAGVAGDATAIEAAPQPRVERDSVTAQGSGARVLPDAGTADEREAARAEAVADALADAAQKAERAAERAGVELGPPEAVAVDAPTAPACAPATAAAGTPATGPAAPAPTAEAVPAPAPPEAGCTVAADVSVTYPTQGTGASASPSP